ncbi:MAG: hypothetical protein DHS20C02_06420 [Micavibrio sp.]|nr:MAG: hypothetical protein DHS20C02_06420 [Micavibrio sp.]
MTMDLRGNFDSTEALKLQEPIQEKAEHDDDGPFDPSEDFQVPEAIAFEIKWFARQTCISELEALSKNHREKSTDSHIQNGAGALQDLLCELDSLKAIIDGEDSEYFVNQNVRAIYKYSLDGDQLRKELEEAIELAGYSQPDIDVSRLTLMILRLQTVSTNDYPDYHL